MTDTIIQMFFLIHAVLILYCLKRNYMLCDHGDILKATLKDVQRLRLLHSEAYPLTPIHYYGKIVIQGVDMEYDGQPGCSTMIFDKNIPLAHYTYEFELKRPLTKEEIDKNPERWGDCYHEGDLTNCFESIDDVIELAKEVFKMRFTGEWEFFIDSPSYNGRMEIDSI